MYMILQIHLPKQLVELKDNINSYRQMNL
jgi:hypothetical protein